jgi:two-component system, sensor histidine kinase and response regulator
VFSTPPDIILMDVNMPGKNGYEVCSALKASPRFNGIPVVFISAIHDTEVKTQAFKVGGVDYITKPVHRDEVLARVRTHLDTRRRQVEMERLQQQKDDMLRMVSHDLKNPLSSILNAEKLLALKLRDVIADSPMVAESLDIIERNVGKMMSLIRDLLDVSRVESTVEIQMEPVWASAYLNKHLNDFKLEAKGKRIELRFVPLTPDVQVWLAPRRFGQVLTNLISNAIKYTREGGTVEVAATVEAQQFVIGVRDNGLGIPTTAIPHLFDKFYRVPTDAHLEQNGSGLGLAIVKTIVEQHNGKIYVESVLGQGTTFTVAIPCVEPALAQAAV